ncbi:MAG: apolipoprotein N-acyltransferase [Sorangium cellulosum]|nr:MAG: apolipoprotein N-acyltransferase [Sorangium cellulosum]
MGYFTLAPLLIAIRGRQVVVAAALGLGSGTLTNFLGFFWLLDTLQSYSGFPTLLCIFVLLLLSLAQGGRMALFSGLVCALHQKRWPWIGSVSTAFVTSEVLYPLLLPWYFGAALHSHPLLMQTADLGGPILVGLPLAVVAAAIATCFDPNSVAPRIQRPPRSSLLAAGGALILPIVYGMLRIPIVDQRSASAPKARIGVVQGNVPMPPTAPQTLHQRFEAQVQRSIELENQGAQLILWSESAFIHPLTQGSETQDVRRTLQQRVHVPMLVGALVETSPTRIYNTALLIASDGSVLGRYDKQHLLPFGEYLPLGEHFPELYRLSPASGRISQGVRSTPIPFEDKRITVLICYEDILPGWVVDAVHRHRPHLLVNLTNDAWFGESSEPLIHLALSKFRAVEHRRYLVRATNTGESAVVDPVGRRVASAQPYREASFVSEVRWLHGWTLYGLWGNVPWYLIAIGVGLGVIIQRPKKEKSFE